MARSIFRVTEKLQDHNQQNWNLDFGQADKLSIYDAMWRGLAGF